VPDQDGEVQVKRSVFASKAANITLRQAMNAVRSYLREKEPAMSKGKNKPCKPKPKGCLS
jgi:hypothetical protein